MSYLDYHTFWILGGLFACMAVCPAFVLYVLTYQRKRAPRLNPQDLSGELLKVKFALNGRSAEYSIDNISRTGLGFSFSSQSEPFLIEGKLPLKIFSHESEELDVEAKVVYMLLDADNQRIRVGVEFLRPLQNDLLFDVLKLNQDIFDEALFKNVTSLEEHRIKCPVVESVNDKAA